MLSANAQQLRALPLLPENPSSLPSTHVGRPPTTILAPGHLTPSFDL